MPESYYIYDPSDNLALAQAILLANGDNEMSYIVPFANKTGVPDLTDPAQKALSILGKPQGPDPVPTGLFGNLAESVTSTTPGGWAAVKDMVKASINQSPPTGWSESSVDDPNSIFTILSSKGLPQLATQLYEYGAWQIADERNPTERGNPDVAYGGQITQPTFVDFAGHFVKTPSLIGQVVVGLNGLTNSGIIYDYRDGEIVLYDGGDIGNPYSGLSVNATGDVTLVNFSITSQGFGPETKKHLGGLQYRSFATGKPIRIFNGNVTLSGDIVVDQVTQLSDRAFVREAGAIWASGSNASVEVKNANVYLGSTRGYDSLFHVETGAGLSFNNSTIYGFTSSNSTAPDLPAPGLLWPDFEQEQYVSPKHLISAVDGSTLSFSNTNFFTEDKRTPQGPYFTILNQPGQTGNWDTNDYGNTGRGDIYIGPRSNLNIQASELLTSIITAPSAGTVAISDSVIGGKAKGRFPDGSLVQLMGGTASIENSLIDSLDALGTSTVAMGANAHVLDTRTSRAVPVTNLGDYTGLNSFAGPSQTTALEAWGDKDNPNAKVLFEFVGPQGTTKTAAGLNRELRSFISQPSPPQVDGSGALVHTLQIAFSEPVGGFDKNDLQQALGSAATAAGWLVNADPVSRDGGTTWTATITAPSTSNSRQSIQLVAGAANSSFSNILASEASNILTLESAQAGGAPSGGGSAGGGSTGGGSTPSEPTLRLSDDGLGLIVDGVAGSGLWLNIEALSASTSWQNGLELITADGTALGAVGATPESRNLGRKEIYLAAGQELRFAQSSRNNPTNTTPDIRLVAENGGFRLRLNDSQADQDYDDLVLRITSSLSASDPNAITMARLQRDSDDAILDLTGIPTAGATLSISILTDAAFTNRFGLVKLEGDAITGYSVAGVAAANTDAFRNAVRDNLINPGGAAITAGGRTARTASWDLSAADAGTYAAVVINPDGQVFTFGATASDGQQHVKVLGDNTFGFEDKLASRGSDWDYDDFFVQFSLA